MFFTVIIPSYNPRKYVSTILDSIQKSYCSRGDIEIIFSDDCSEEQFDDLFKNYPLLDIKVIRNDKHYGFPRVGKQNGLNVAQGQWICFCDQDDEFLPNAFDEVKNLIEEQDIHEYLVTNFYCEQDGVLHEMNETLNWQHGKFYENKFLKKHDIKYSDITFNEDTNFSGLVTCKIHELQHKVNFFNRLTYIWHLSDNSLSHKDGYKSYFFSSMPDLINGSLGIYFDLYKKCNIENQEYKEFLERTIDEAFFGFYCYIQGMLNPKYKCPDIPNSYYKLLAEYFKAYKNYRNISTDDYLNYVYNTYMLEFRDIRNKCCDQIPMIEYQSYKDWINTYIVPNEP